MLCFSISSAVNRCTVGVCEVQGCFAMKKLVCLKHQFYESSLRARPLSPRFITCSPVLGRGGVALPVGAVFHLVQPRSSIPCRLYLFMQMCCRQLLPPAQVHASRCQVNFLTYLLIFLPCLVCSKMAILLISSFPRTTSARCRAATP